MESLSMPRELPQCLQPDRAPGIWNEPLDWRDLATRLETEGVTDTVAREGFGFASTAAMADEWLPRVLQHPAKPRVEESPKKGWREYLKGISFALPLLVSSATILLFGFALWGGDLSIDEATAVGLGTITSFLLSGGFVQVMARRGLFFSATKQHRRCRESTWWWVRAGSGAMLIGIVALLATSAYWGWLPLSLSLLAAAFCLVLGFFWIATGILHYLNGGWVILGVTAGGIAIVGILRKFLGAPLLLAQFAAIAVAGAAAAAEGYRRLRKIQERSNSKVPPVSARDVLVLWPYFVYGLFYYTLLFADRIVAWTAHTEAASLAVQFRGDYESAINLGLLAFILQVGWVEYSVALFYQELTKAEQTRNLGQIESLRRSMERFYWRRIARFAPVAAVASAIPIALSVRPAAEAPPWVTWWSLAAYPLLIVGLWNCSLLFGLARAPKAAAAAGWATAADLLGGYLLSRLGTHDHAIVGFALGALIFASLSGHWALRALRRVDHAFYAASQ
jgi:hypothetical protein